MTMTKKQLKALKRRKRISKKRNIRNNNDPKGPNSLRLTFGRQSRTYQLYRL